MHKKNNKKNSQKSQFLEAPLIRQADSKLKNPTIMFLIKISMVVIIDRFL